MLVFCCFARCCWSLLLLVCCLVFLVLVFAVLCSRNVIGALISLSTVLMLLSGVAIWCCYLMLMLLVDILGVKCLVHFSVARR